MKRVLVPRYPGVLSATGMVLAEATRDYSAPLGGRVVDTEHPELVDDLAAGLDELSNRARADLGEDLILEPAVDMRYEGQGYELTVPLDGTDLQKLLVSFHNQHRRRYGHDSVQRQVEAITLRLRARRLRDAVPLPELPKGSADPSPALKGSRTAFFDAAVLDAPIYDRELLRAGNRISGPAIVSQLDSTTLIPPGWHAEVQAPGSMILEQD